MTSHTITDPDRSPFGAASTASDVLTGIDLTGKTAVVTGGASGLGLATTCALASAGARVLVPARRPETAQQALAGVEKAEVGQLPAADAHGQPRTPSAQRADQRKPGGNSIGLLRSHAARAT